VQRLSLQAGYRSSSRLAVVPGASSLEAMAASVHRGPGSVAGVWTGVELALGAALAGMATLAGLLFMREPWPNRFDTLGFSLLPANYSASWAHHVTALGSLPVLVVGAVALGLAGWARDWVRGLACALAPLLAVLVVQALAKPLVDRHLSVGGAPSYPSGTVTAIAALATAAVLVAPSALKGVAILASALVVAAACAAVVVLRWHFPTDALGGVWTGAGAVLLVDGLAHLPWTFRLLTRAKPAERA
jgi:membrane-associated phospholipid phosphatase